MGLSLSCRSIAGDEASTVQQFPTATDSASNLNHAVQDNSPYGVAVLSPPEHTLRVVLRQSKSPGHQLVQQRINQRPLRGRPVPPHLTYRLFSSYTAAHLMKVVVHRA